MGMLCLSRKVGEKIVVGDDITITLIEIDRNRIRLAFEAPKGVKIFRSELLEGKDSHEPSSKAPAA